MATRLALFGAEGGTEAINTAKGINVSFVVQLTGLCQIELLAEIVYLKKRGGTFASRRGEYGGVHVDKAMVIQPVADGLDDCRSYSQHGPLADRANP